MQITNLNKILYLILSISLFISLYFNIDSAGSGGYITDFKSTWPLVENPFSFNTNLEIKFPLHYYIASLIYFFLGDKELLRLAYLIIALFVPYFFFICLKKKFNNINDNNLFLFSLILFLFPSFRSAAIWPNTQITGIIFFLISIYFFLEWEAKKKFNNFSKELFLLIFFISLTVYTRQLYAIIFFYFVVIFFLKLNIKTFLQSCALISLFALPGLIFVLFWPKILTVTFAFKIYNSLLVNSSIISFYLIPFFSIIYFFERRSITFEKNDIIFFVFFSLLVYFCSTYFDYNHLMGGGFFIKLSYLFFGSLLLFFATALIGFCSLYYLCKKSYLNSFLIIIILFAFSAYVVFMKYFEPMFIFLLFFFIKTKFTSLFLQNRKYIYLYHSYFLIYLCSAVINHFLLLTK